MIQIKINKANPAFIKAVKESIASRKERFEKYFAEIAASPITQKLKQMNKINPDIDSGS